MRKTRLGFPATAWLSLLLISPASSFTSPNGRAKVQGFTLRAFEPGKPFTLLDTYNKETAASIPSPVVEKVEQLSKSNLPTANIEAKLATVQEPVAKAVDNVAVTTASKLDKTYTLADWLTGKGSEYRQTVQATSRGDRLLAAPSAANNFDRVGNAKEKLSIIKQNTVGLIDSKPTETVHAFKMSALHMPDLSAGYAAVMTSLALQVQAFYHQFQFDKYGVWYGVGAALLWGAIERNAGREEAMAEAKALIASLKPKASEAKEAAAVATAGAKNVEKLVSNADVGVVSYASCVLTADFSFAALVGMVFSTRANVCFVGDHDEGKANKEGSNEKGEGKAS